MLQAATAALSNFFAAPTGLVALLSLIPLLLFYFMKPEPEQKVMPSMAFFMENKKSGKMQQALNTLMQNILLLLHILLVVGMAAAIAQPYITGETRAEKSVIVMDVSASMEDDMQAARSFATSRLGKENTVIVSGESTEVKMIEASAAKARLFIRGLETSDVETDVVSGIETARGYEGKVAVASDLAQTSSDESAVEAIESLSEERKVSAFEAEGANRWGIVDFEPGETSTAEIGNFMEKSVDLRVETPSGVENIGIDAGETREISFETDTGRNKVQLPEDGVSADNTAYVSVPESGTVEVAMIADEENQYFREAVKAIEFTEYSYHAPPLEDEVSADVYVVGETERILESTASWIEEKARSGGASLVVFGQAGLDEKGFESVPADLGGVRNESVELTEPRRISVGRTEMLAASSIQGDSWSDPRGAVVRSDYGSGEVLLYNLDDRDFRYNFFYPVFWRSAFQELDDRRSIEQLNVETGTEIGDTEIDEVGFHNVSGHRYAANMESLAESSSEPEAYTSSVQQGDEKGEKPVQSAAAVLLALLAIGELGYLLWIGEV